MNNDARGLLLLAAVAGGLSLLAPARPVPAPVVVKQGVPQMVQQKAAPPSRASRPVLKKARPEKKRAAVKKKQRTSALPSCSAIRRQVAGMTWAQKMAAYATATPEQVAHGRRCLGQ